MNIDKTITEFLVLLFQYASAADAADEPDDVHGPVRRPDGGSAGHATSAGGRAPVTKQQARVRVNTHFVG
jgi:hypothetical protein